MDICVITNSYHHQLFQREAGVQILCSFTGSSGWWMVCLPSLQTNFANGNPMNYLKAGSSSFPVIYSRHNLLFISNLTEPTRRLTKSGNLIQEGF